MTRARETRAPPRDMDASAFARILTNLIDRVPGAIAAVLVDMEGETVDYSGSLPPYDAKLAAAHWHLVMNEIRDRKPGSPQGPAEWLIVRGEHRCFIVHKLSEGFALVVVLRSRTTCRIRSRAFSVCTREIAEEAAWNQDDVKGSRWYSVDVELEAPPSGSRESPRALRSSRGDLPLDILGAIMGLADRDRGYRIRLRSGIEASLIRERNGQWYVDERIEKFVAASLDDPRAKRVVVTPRKSR
jgi:predicted regulator of Ras-like GTPase activity (Roadblock/LC7/MglB family)